MIATRKKKTHNNLLTQIFNKKYHSVFIAILGPNQSGKTAMALYLMEMCYFLGLYKVFAGNVPLIDPPFPYTFIEDLPTLKRFCQMQKDRVLFLGDEMGSWAPKDQPWLNVKIIQELQQVRKYKLSFVGCAIDRVDSRVLNEKHFHGYFDKQSKNRQDRAIYVNWMYHWKGKIYDIPNTSVNYDTYYSAMFYMTARENAEIPLSPEHEIVKKYLKFGSWKLADVHPQEGKRAIGKVLRFHFENCITNILPGKGSETITESHKAS